MPQFTYDDRNMIAAEATLWNVRELLVSIESAGAWDQRIRELHDTTQAIAKEMQEYNDQFESID